MNKMLEVKELNRILKGVPYKKQSIKRLVEYKNSGLNNDNKFMSIADVYFSNVVLSKLDNLSLKDEVIELLSETKDYIKNVKYLEKEKTLDNIINVFEDLRYLNLDGEHNRCYRTKSFVNDEKRNVAIIGYGCDGNPITKTFFGVPDVQRLDSINFNREFIVATFGALNDNGSYTDKVLKVIEFK